MIEPILSVFWLAGIIARAAEAGGYIWWPWPLEWEPRWPLVLMEIRLWLLWWLLKLFVLLLVVWPVRGLVVLSGWTLWQAHLYRSGPVGGDNVVPLRRWQQWR